MVNKLSAILQLTYLEKIFYSHKRIILNVGILRFVQRCKQVFRFPELGSCFAGKVVPGSSKELVRVMLCREINGFGRFEEKCRFGILSP